MWKILSQKKKVEHWCIQMDGWMDQLFITSHGPVWNMSFNYVPIQLTKKKKKIGLRRNLEKLIKLTNTLPLNLEKPIRHKS